MFLLALALGCGSDPVVTIKTAKVEGMPLPPDMKSFVSGTLQKKVETCYAEGLAADPELGGTAVVTSVGSHGIMKVEGSGDADKLVRCAAAPMESARNQRTLGDGDVAVGVELTVTYSPG